MPDAQQAHRQASLWVPTPPTAPTKSVPDLARASATRCMTRTQCAVVRSRPRSMIPADRTMQKSISPLLHHLTSLRRERSRTTRALLARSLPRMACTAHGARCAIPSAARTSTRPRTTRAPPRALARPRSRHSTSTPAAQPVTPTASRRAMPRHGEDPTLMLIESRAEQRLLRIEH